MATWAGVAPFCGPKISAASRNGVTTSQATTTSAPPSLAGAPIASTAPQPPSEVDDPPTPTTTRRAPASTAARTSCPTPAVEARTGSSPDGEGSRALPMARADSITAVGLSPAADGPTMCHSTSTGSPSGPATVEWWTSPCTASRIPSPPSAIGTSSAVQPAARAEPAAAAATSEAAAVPRNLSGAATRWPMNPSMARQHGPYRRVGRACPRFTQRGQAQGVRTRGFEPLPPKGPGPKPGASTSSATPAAAPDPGAGRVYDAGLGGPGPLLQVSPAEPSAR